MYKTKIIKNALRKGIWNNPTKRIQIRKNTIVPPKDCRNDCKWKVRSQFK